MDSAFLDDGGDGVKPVEKFGKFEKMMAEADQVAVHKNVHGDPDCNMGILEKLANIAREKPLRLVKATVGLGLIVGGLFTANPSAMAYGAELVAGESKFVLGAAKKLLSSDEGCGCPMKAPALAPAKA